MTTKHNHPMIFGRREAGCPRCEEMNRGAPAVRWTNRRAEEAKLVAEIRAHNCVAAKCGPVCTAFDW
jgi:hypothetical protein